MPLSRHIQPEDVLAASRDHPHRKHTDRHERHVLEQSWTRDEDAASAPKYTFPTRGIPSKAAYQLLHDEAALDGNPTLNLASFVHTWMPDDGVRLFNEAIDKNLADQDEYPAAQIIHNRCVSMLAHLWKAPTADTTAVGTATAGSSEAIMLAGLALKKRWQDARKRAGKDHYHPNIVFGANAQVALEKFARYWDVEARMVPVNRETSYVLKPEDAIRYIDENTIGVMVILGSTYNGAFEDVGRMSSLLDDLQERTGLDIPIHVDAASGGFIAPFAYPEYKWAFDVSRVVSINSSGHKFGLVYPGLGWLIFRDESCLHKDLVFELHYLGSVEYSYTLNFSKPAAPVFAQMFNFLNLGYNGYAKIAFKDLRNARMLARALERTYFTVLSEIHRPALDAPEGVDEEDPQFYVKGLPVVTFRLNDEYKQKYPHVKQAWIQTSLRTKGWIVPNYNAPKGEEQTEMLRVVVRESMTEDLIERLIVDILQIVEAFMDDSDGTQMMIAYTGGSGPHQPDMEHSRPKAANFGGADEKADESVVPQAGYSRQC